MKQKPNILFIMCDQMRQDALGCNGNTVIKTPNIDKLANSGVNFVNAYTPNPICVPARASLTTGCYPHKCTGFKDNTGPIKEGFPLLGNELKKAGYETYAMGKLHYLPYKKNKADRTTYGIENVELMESGRMIKKFSPSGKERGIEDYHDYLYDVGWGGYYRGHGLGNNDVIPSASPVPEEFFVDTWVADRAISHMSDHIKEKSDKPFFMWASFPKPHSAYDPPVPYNKMYDPREMPDSHGTIDMIKERGLDINHLDYYKFAWHLLSPEAKKVITAHYYGLISLQDKQIGRMLEFLEDNNLAEDTIIIYTTDHGDLMGDFDLFFKKSFYTGSIKIPLMISFPNTIPSKKVSEELVGLQDLLPTIMSLIKKPLNEAIDGKDLTKTMLEDKPVREYYVAQCEGVPKQQYMVADKKWKYIYHQLGGIEELYNLSDDPYELENLSDNQEDSYTEVKTKMRDYLIKWCIDNNDLAMLENGKLVSTKRDENLQVQPPPNPFGKRFH